MGQISIVKPKIILLCGATAVQSFVEQDFKISLIRGKWLNIFDDIEVMAIFHPSYLLRNHSTEQGSPRWLMKKIWKTLKTNSKCFKKRIRSKVFELCKLSMDYNQENYAHE